jgi:hypothetical protein
LLVLLLRGGFVIDLGNNYPSGQQLTHFLSRTNIIKGHIPDEFNPRGASHPKFSEGCLTSFRKFWESMPM